MSTENNQDKRKYKHGSREDAQTRYEDRIEKNKSILCPLLHATCNIDCICYDPPKVINAGSTIKPHWSCTGGYCTCYMLVGPV